MNKIERIYNKFKDEVLNVSALPMVKVEELKKELKEIGFDYTYGIDDKNFKLIKCAGEEGKPVYKIECLYKAGTTGQNVVDLLNYLEQLDADKDRVCLTKYFGPVSFTSVFDDGKLKEMNIVDQEKDRTVTLTAETLECVLSTYKEHGKQNEKLNK